MGQKVSFALLFEFIFLFCKVVDCTHERFVIKVTSNKAKEGGGYFRSFWGDLFDNFLFVFDDRDET